MKEQYRSLFMALQQGTAGGTHYLSTGGGAQVDGCVVERHFVVSLLFAVQVVSSCSPSNTLVDSMRVP